MKDVGGVAGTRFRTDGRTEGRTDTRTDEGHFYSPPPPTSGDNKALPSYKLPQSLRLR